jgi:hypothetical protein
MGCSGGEAIRQNGYVHFALDDNENTTDNDVMFREKTYFNFQKNLWMLEDRG